MNNDKMKELKSLLNDPILMNNMSRVIKNITQPMTEEEKAKRRENSQYTVRQMIDTLEESKVLISGLTIELEEEKARADKLQARWDELKKHYEKECRKSLGILEFSKNDDVLKVMSDIENKEDK